MMRVYDARILPSEFTLVITNSDVRVKDDHSFFRCLFEKASFRVCCDGAANFLKNISPLLIPDLIVGDFDSIDLDVYEYYRDIGVEIVDYHDQSKTDLEKALSFCHEEVIVYTHELSSLRMDHVFATYNVILRYPDHVCWHTKDSINIPVKEDLFMVGLKGEKAGLIPLFGKVDSVSTVGFEFNLSNQTLEFAGLISTSNTVTEDSAFIKASQPLLLCASTPNKEYMAVTASREYMVNVPHNEFEYSIMDPNKN